jgi:hypothetical protein
VTDRSELAHGALRGAIGAMAMTGMRRFAVEMGMLHRPPPQQIVREAAPGLRRAAPTGRERAVEEVAHWAYGAGGGVAFAVLPDAVRRLPWAGPAYGLTLWLGFELVLAPVLGLSHHRRNGVVARVVLMVDHALYGLVLSELRERPRT